MASGKDGSNASGKVGLLTKILGGSNTTPPTKRPSAILPETVITQQPSGSVSQRHEEEQTLKAQTGSKLTLNLTTLQPLPPPVAQQAVGNVAGGDPVIGPVFGVIGTPVLSIRLVLTQPHATCTVSRKVSLRIPLNPEAFSKLLQLGIDVARSSTLTVPTAPPGAGRIGIGVILGGRMIELTSQRALIKTVDLFRASMSSTKEPVDTTTATFHQLYILVSPSAYVIIRPNEETAKQNRLIVDDPALTQLPLPAPATAPNIQTESLYRTPPGGQKSGSRWIPGGTSSPRSSVGVGHRRSSLITSSSVSESSITSSSRRRHHGYDIDMETLKTRLQLSDQPIGRGTFGTVYKGIDRETAFTFAIKIVKLQHGDDSCLRSRLNRLTEEVTMLRAIKGHKNIVTYFGSVLDSERLELFIIMEHMTCGSVRDRINEFGPLGESLIRIYGQQVLDGLRYLHLHKIVHLDLRCANLLLGEGRILKVCDFGCSFTLADIISGGGTRAQTPHDDLQLGSRPVVMTPVYWMSPELARDSRSFASPNQRAANFELFTAADVWAFGCVVVEMATKWPPFYDPNAAATATMTIGSSTGDSSFNELDLLLMVATSPYPLYELPSNSTSELKKLLKNVFTTDWKSRPKPTQIETMPFFCMLNPAA